MILVCLALSSCLDLTCDSNKKFLKDLPSVCFGSEIHGGEVMRINMCAAIIVMQCVFLIGAHVKAQQVIQKFSLPFSLCQM